MFRFFLIVLFVSLSGVCLAQNKNTSSEPAKLSSSIEIITQFRLDTALVSPPLYSSQKIYTIDKNGKINCFNSEGKIIWSRKGYSSAVTKLVTADDMLAFATSNGELITLNASTGEQIQSIGIDDSITTNLVLLNYRGSNELMMPKQTESKSSIIFGTASGIIYCLDLETLQEFWKNNDAKGKIETDPVIIENKILCSRTDGFIYCTDSRNGLLNWRWKEIEETDFSNSKIICDGKKIFAVSKANQLYCIDLLLGKLQWKFEKQNIQNAIGLSSNKKNLYVKSNDRKFLILSSETGKMIKEIKLEEASDENTLSPIESKGKIFFTYNGKLFQIGKGHKIELCLKLPDETFNSFSKIDDNKLMLSSSKGTIIIFKSR